MDRLTREQIAKLMPEDNVPNSKAVMRYADDIRTLCDMALQSLSLESVRSEALGYAVHNEQGYFVGLYKDASNAQLVVDRGKDGEAILPVYAAPNGWLEKVCDLVMHYGGTRNQRIALCRRIRKLQSPARVAEGGHTDHPLRHFDRTCIACQVEAVAQGWNPPPVPESPAQEQPCPRCGEHLNVMGYCPIEDCPLMAAQEQPGEQNVAAMVARLRTWESTSTHGQDCKRAAAMIEKLGQGWVPVSERLPIEEEEGDQLIGYFQYKGGSWMVGAISTDHLLRGTFQGRCTHWMPLPPPPPERP